MDEIGAAVIAEIPVVVAVNAAILPEWRAYAGETDNEFALHAQRRLDDALRSRHIVGKWLLDEDVAPAFIALTA